MATSVTDEQAEGIDAFLGDGTYDTWHEFDIEADMQLSRKKRADAALWRVDHKLAVLSPYGTDWVEKLQNDCAWAIDLIKQKKFPDPAQFSPLLKIFPAALDAADLMLTDAEAIPTLWLVAGAAAVPKGGFTVAEAYLSGGTGTAAESKYAKFALESMEEVEKAGHTVQHIAKRGGKFLTIAGFYFDVEEVLHAKGNVKKIKALIEKANKEFKDIQDRLTEAVKGFQRLQGVLVTNEAAARREIEDKRRERDDLIRQYSYSLIKPVAWKLVDDYSRVGR